MTGDTVPLAQHVETQEALGMARTTIAELRAQLAEAKNVHARMLVRLSQDAMFKRATESEDRELALIDAVREWAMRNEIAAPPLEWAGPGALLDPKAASTPPADEGGPR